MFPLGHFCKSAELDALRIIKKKGNQRFYRRWKKHFKIHGVIRKIRILESKSFRLKRQKWKIGEENVMILENLFSMVMSYIQISLVLRERIE